MVFLVPIIHAIDIGAGLIDYGLVGVEHFKVIVRDQSGAFDDDLFVDIQARHFEIDPKKFLLIDFHKWLDSRTGWKLGQHGLDSDR